MSSAPHPGAAGAVSLLDLRVNPMSSSDLVRLAGRAIEERAQYIIANHNLHSMYLWYHQPRMRRFYDAADYIHIDGMGLILIAKLLGVPLQRGDRAAYLDFVPLLLPQAVQMNSRIFYLGSRPGVAEKAAVKLRAQYPGLQLRTRHGHFDATRSSAENQSVLAEIKEYDPHILFVGMGMPRQEIWIHENFPQLSANVIFPCGAFLDYHAGEIPTAPRWLSMLYLEWLFRLCAEPARLWRRYLWEPWFVLGQIARHRLGMGGPYVTSEDGQKQ